MKGFEVQPQPYIRSLEGQTPRVLILATQERVLARIGPRGPIRQPRRCGVALGSHAADEKRESDRREIVDGTTTQGGRYACSLPSLRAVPFRNGSVVQRTNG